MMAYGSSDTTKLKIIHAAGDLAAERGFDNVSTRMVADRSGQNIGSIHYHFGSKDSLFEAVVQEAMHNCAESLEEDFVSGLDENSPPEDLSRVIRTLIEGQITDMFRSDRPAWHVPVIYQLLQREDHLYDLFDEAVIQPSTKAITRFFRIIDPDMDAEEIHLRAVLMKMPIFAHGDYMKAMLRMLKTDHYSDSYLQRMEDLVVKQTQLLLGLPLDK
jgi:TetR/AcrR family transcriptional regulator, regulator of cefoperazone and chloramphenicol sensitivity